jgi:peptide deformylase
VAVLPIYVYDQPVLRKKARPVKQPDEHFRRLSEDMFETMYKANGLGLAATQVGSLYRLLVLDLSGSEGYPEFPPTVMINPEVLHESGSSVMEEGCLSLPDLREDVERPEQIVVRYRDLAFQQNEVEAHGLFARAVLHELDHLDGVLFIDRIGTIKRKLLRGRLNKMKKGEIEVPYPVVTAQRESVARTE